MRSRRRSTRDVRRSRSPSARSRAFDASATHLYVPGLKLHMRNAVRHGATAEEIMEVLEIASVIGIHTATTAAPVLAEEAAARQAATPGSDR